MGGKTKATVKGTVLTSEEIGKSSGGWGKMAVTFKEHEGEIYNLSIPPDKTDVIFDVGDKIELIEGNFANTWFYKDNLSSGNAPTGTSSNGKESSGSKYQKPESKNWDEINKYQMEVRDPKIEFQFYANLVKDVYTTGLINFPDVDPDEVIDKIVSKTKDIVKSL